MPSLKMELFCANGHKLFLAYWRNSAKMGRIRDLLYCPTCDEFYRVSSKQIQVKVKQ